RPARSRTLRCLEMAGRLIANGSASSVTEASPDPRRARIARRGGAGRAGEKGVGRAAGNGDGIHALKNNRETKNATGALSSVRVVASPDRSATRELAASDGWQTLAFGGPKRLGFVGPGVVVFQTIGGAELRGRGLEDRGVGVRRGAEAVALAH